MKKKDHKEKQNMSEDVWDDNEGYAEAQHHSFDHITFYDEENMNEAHKQIKNILR